MLILIHHALGDAYSMMLMSQTLKDAYLAVSNKQALRPPPPHSYVDYSAWQRKEWEEGKMAEQLRYWKNKLRGAPPLLELPTDHVRPAVASYQGGRVMVRFRPHLATGVKDLANACKTTAFQVLLTAYKVRSERAPQNGPVTTWSYVCTPLSGMCDSVMRFCGDAVMR